MLSLIPNPSLLCFYVSAHCSRCARFSLEKKKKTIIPGDFRVDHQGRHWEQTQKILLFFLLLPCGWCCALSSSNHCCILGKPLNTTVDDRSWQTRRRERKKHVIHHVDSEQARLGQRCTICLRRCPSFLPSSLSPSVPNSDPHISSCTNYSSMSPFILPWTTRPPTPTTASTPPRSGPF